MKSLKNLFSVVLGLAVLQLFSVSVSADNIDRWLNHTYPNGDPEVTYSGPAFELKFSHPSPPASMIPPIWDKALQWQEEVTNGKLAFKVYGAGSLHDAKGGFKAVRSGISDYATCFVAHEGRGFEMSKVFELPFVTPTNKLAAVRIVSELAPKYFKPEFEKRGVHFGYMVLVGAADIMSNKPIRKLEDLEGLKVIAQGFSPEAADALGMVVVNIPYPDIYTSFQQGIVDAVLWVDPGFIPYKIYELAKYHTTLNISAQHIDTCINPRSFKKLPEDLQNTFYQLQQRIPYAIAKKVGVEFREKAVSIYKKQGVEMITLPDSELERWKARMEPVLDQWAEKMEAKGKPGRQLLADIERLTRKYNQMSDEELFDLIVNDPVEGIIEY